METYDLAVIGGGAGGYMAAQRAGRLGMRTCLIERDRVGGVWLHAGCISTKALMASAQLYAKVKRAPDLGILVGTPKPVWAAMKQRSQEVSDRMASRIRGLLDQHAVATKFGRAHFVDCHTVEIETRQGEREHVKSSYFIIATGARPMDLPGMAFDGERILDAADVMQMAQIPKSLVVVGATTAGCEFASLFRALDCEVTLVEAQERLLPFEDTDVAFRLTYLFKTNKVRLYLKTKVLSIEKGAHLTVHLSTGDSVVADCVILAVGRRRNTDHLGLEAAGVRLAGDAIWVDPFLETSSKGIFAVGDVLKSPMLAHVASAEALHVVDEIHKGVRVPMDYTACPTCIFTIPEIASVGMRLEEARERGLSAIQIVVPFTVLGSAQLRGETEGFVKLVIDAKNATVLGGHILGEGATDLIAEVALAVRHRLKVGDIAQTIHAHPTFAEAIQEAAHGVLGDTAELDAVP